VDFGPFFAPKTMDDDEETSPSLCTRLHKYLLYLCSELVHPRLGHAVVAIQKNDYNMMFGLFCREFMMFNVKHCISSVREKNEKLLLVVMNTKQRFSSYMILHALQHHFPIILKHTGIP